VLLVFATGEECGEGAHSEACTVRQSSDSIQTALSDGIPGSLGMYRKSSGGPSAVAAPLRWRPLC
jgi:hypothetical protein